MVDEVYVLNSKFLIQLQKWLTAAVVIAVASFTVNGPVQAAGSYAAYANRLLDNLPKGAEVRPDLEALLDGMASAYRTGKGHQGLEASELMRAAARAQAVDMMLAGKSGHKSRNGEGLDTRFGGFVEDVDLYRARGENAASDRRKGTADAGKARRLFQSWLDSSGHRRNLMKRDYEFVSTGVIQRGDELWAVQIFWSRPVEPGEGGGLFFSIQ